MKRPFASGSNGRQRVLVYRLGSLGDTVVALPALRLVANAFPQAERWALTNYSVNSKAAPMAAVLDGTGLIHGYLAYPLRLRSISGLIRLRREIRRISPNVLVYLAAPRGRVKAWRDVAFFLSCGIKRFIGVPYAAAHQKPMLLEGGMYEYEGARLLRCLDALGAMHLDDPAAFDLSLSDSEHNAARIALGRLTDGCPLLAASVGAKVDVKDWGDEKWTALISNLGQRLRGWGLVMVGAPEEEVRSERLLANWPGDRLNLCGRVNVRESAAALAHANIYLGHDSGPMHLAAAVGTPCVAVFSSRNRPGEWFPYGRHHRVVFHPIWCQGCELNVCTARDKMCIRSITVDEVEREVVGLASQVSATTPGHLRPEDRI